MKKLAALFWLLAAPAWAQVAVLQTGPVTQNDLMVWSQDHIAQSAANLLAQQHRGINPLYITDSGGIGLHIESAPNSGAYNYVTLGHDASGNFTMDIGAGGGAAGQNCTIKFNGTSYACVGLGGGNVTGPVGIGATGDIACFNGTSGNVIKDCGGLTTPLTFGFAAQLFSVQNQFDIHGQFFATGGTPLTDVLGASCARPTKVPNQPDPTSGIWNLCLTDSGTNGYSNSFVSTVWVYGANQDDNAIVGTAVATQNGTGGAGVVGVGQAHTRTAVAIGSELAATCHAPANDCIQAIALQLEAGGGNGGLATLSYMNMISGAAANSPYFGINVGPGPAINPFHSTGSAIIHIDNAATVTDYGIDLSGGTQNIAAFKSANFSVDGTGGLVSHRSNIVHATQSKLTLTSSAGTGGYSLIRSLGNTDLQDFSIYDAAVGTSRLSIGTTGGVQIGNPTGGDKGAGTLNMSGAYYSNGTLGINKTCTLNTTSVGTGITITILGGIVTGTTNC